MTPMPTPPDDEYLKCPAEDCGHEQDVSPHDPDASFSELWSHVSREHTGHDRRATSRLMATITRTYRRGTT